MIDIKSPGVNGPKAADAKKKTAGSTATGGTSFATMLEQASAPGSTQAPSSPAFTPVNHYTPDDEQPSGQKQASRLMDALTELAEDALSGQPTAALSKLQTYLATNAHDKANLTPAQKQALDEVETRAAVEAEKLKG